MVQRVPKYVTHDTGIFQNIKNCVWRITQYLISKTQRYVTSHTFSSYFRITEPSLRVKRLLNSVPKVMKINCIFPDSAEFLDICLVFREWNVSTDPLLGAAWGRVHRTLETNVWDWQHNSHSTLVHVAFCSRWYYNLFSYQDWSTDVLSSVSKTAERNSKQLPRMTPSSLIKAGTFNKCFVILYVTDLHTSSPFSRRFYFTVRWVNVVETKSPTKVHWNIRSLQSCYNLKMYFVYAELSYKASHNM